MPAARLDDAFAFRLDAAGTVGGMPNIPANRLNAQFDLNGPGFTVAAEELSGLRALEQAMRALAAGEVAVVAVSAQATDSAPMARSSPKRPSPALLKFAVCRPQSPWHQACGCTPTPRTSAWSTISVATPLVQDTGS